MADLSSLGFSIRRELPPGLLDREAHELHDILPGPTLFHLEGEREPPLFVSLLLHGNETTGYLALREVLRHYQTERRVLPRSLICFIGNVEAARHGLRRCQGQVDFNRIWAGGELPEHAMARQVLDYVESAGPVAAIDIHNNTGRNPLYACINRVELPFIQLAGLFSDTVVYFTEPHEVIALNLAKFCTATTLECGRAGEPLGVEKVRELLEHCLNNDNPLLGADPIEDIDVFHTVARITVPEGAVIGFGEEAEHVDLRFPEHFDEMNFRLLETGTEFGRRLDPTLYLDIRNDDGEDVADTYISYEEDRILTRRLIIPSMLTRDIRVIYQDCLGYIMEHYPLQKTITQPDLYHHKLP